MRYHCIPSSIAKIKNNDYTKCCQECGETGSLTHFQQEYSMVQLLWKVVWQFLLKLNMYLPYDSATTLPGIYHREMKIYVHAETCTWLFIAALLIIAPNWKPSSCPSVSKWINKLWYIHANEAYSAIKWTNVGNCNNLGETPGNHDGWKKKAADHMIPFMQPSWNNEVTEMEKSSVAARDQGWMRDEVGWQEEALCWWKVLSWFWGWPQEALDVFLTCRQFVQGSFVLCDKKEQDKDNLRTLSECYNWKYGFCRGCRGVSLELIVTWKLHYWSMRIAF